MKNQIWLSCSAGAFFFKAEFDLVDTLVFVVDHHFLVAVVGVVRDVRIDSFFVGDGGTMLPGITVSASAPMPMSIRTPLSVTA